MLRLGKKLKKSFRAVMKSESAMPKSFFEDD